MAAMRKEHLLGLMLLTSFVSRAQDLTVKIIDQSTQKPVGDALVRLHYGCMHSMRPIELKQRTNAAGVAVFHSVALSPHEFCVFPDYAFQPQEQPYVFTSPQDAATYSKYSGRIISTLPNQIAFHVRRLSLSERIRKLFRYD
jgi:hypothetical protein